LGSASQAGFGKLPAMVVASSVMGREDAIENL
jgi:hypothetical protein